MPENVFQWLDPRLASDLVALGFKDLTPIQSQSIPRVLQGESVLLITPMGHE